MRRALRILSSALITAGVVVALDIAATLLWKEPLSTVYGAIRQGEAADSLAELERAFPSPADLRAADRETVDRKRVAVLANRFEERVHAGDGIGRIEIERIDLDAVFVEGTDTASLRQGPGHYSNVGASEGVGGDDGSAFPGQDRTVGIAGHRTTYLAPFRHLDKLRRGDGVLLEMPYGTFRYRVTRTKIVSPTRSRCWRTWGTSASC